MTSDKATCARCNGTGIWTVGQGCYACGGTGIRQAVPKLTAAQRNVNFADALARFLRVDARGKCFGGRAGLTTLETWAAVDRAAADAAYEGLTDKQKLAISNAIAERAHQ